MLRPVANSLGSARGAQGQRGAALASVLVVFVGLVGLIYASSVMSISEVMDSRRSLDDLRTGALAEAGVERTLNFLEQVIEKSETVDPMAALTTLFPGAQPNSKYVGEALLDGTQSQGEYSVTMRLLASSSDQVTIAIDSTGYLPAAPVNLAAGAQVKAWTSVSATIQYNLAPSRVFNYAYFINNWGWLYGDTIFCNGNARSNGQFDAGGYAPRINGQPTYESVNWNGSTATLTGYQDDNEDGAEDGQDGGIWSGWDIVNSANVVGVGGNAANQHDYDGAVEMPNLSNLAPYEAAALEEGGSIRVSGSEVSNAVYGDGGIEKQNLYLVGTAADPIVLDGRIVVRGDVIISGYVTGQGAIYAGGNVYIPDSVRYLDGPSTARPTGNTQTETEAWLSSNWEKDFLGLFAGENIVIGDYTDSDWRRYVSGWMASGINRSDEDAGSDGIPNTKAGMDGILGTADDDLLEDDGIFTVESYSQDDADLGLIPAGFSVGDAIPGTGEDIDGDGTFDDTTTLADMDFGDALNSGLWGGNRPMGLTNYSDVASMTANNIDAVMYTNHTFAYVVFGGDDAVINGSIVSRNEDIVYGTPTVSMNYDCRLLGGKSGLAGDLLPHVIESAQMIGWRQLTTDPNRYQVAP